MPLPRTRTGLNEFPIDKLGEYSSSFNTSYDREFHNDPENMQFLKDNMTASDIEKLMKRYPRL